MPMITLGIESTCDETSASIVRNGEEILSLSIASSADIHARYGGVFPELACRRHIEAIIPIIQEAMEKANVTPNDIDLIAVAKGPGLVGALLIGMQAAKGLAIGWNKPLIGVNHVEAHLYAAMMGAPKIFPALGLVLSGGHTLLLQIHDIGNYSSIATTVDDAIGEAFDKVAVLLGLPYPGGPHVEKLALSGDPKRHPFKAGHVKRSPLDFSFSGIKTSVLYAVKDLCTGQKMDSRSERDKMESPRPPKPIAEGAIGEEERRFREVAAAPGVHFLSGTEVKDKELTFQDKADIAASFQEAAFKDLLYKTELALKNFPASAIYLGGGVCNNTRLRALFSQKFPHLQIQWPSQSLCLDNAAMIAGLGFQKFLRNHVGDPLDLEVAARIPIA